MHKKRIEKLIQVCAKNNFDGFIIKKRENQYYMSGFTGEGLTLITPSKNFLITDSRYIEQTKNEVKDFEIVEIQNSLSAYECLYKIAKELGLRNLGFESHSLTFKEYEKLLDCFNEKIRLSKTDGIIEKLRLIKDSYEIDLIKSAQKVTDSAFEHILPFIKPNVSELELSAELEYFIKKSGCSLAFDTIVVSGPRTSLPHGVPTNRTLKPNDFVTIDFGARFSGYCSDMTRTVILGNPSKEQLKIYNTVLDAQLKALEHLKPYQTGKDADKVARTYIDSKGFGNYFGHGLGHGVGLEIHELPRLSPNAENKLMPGMIVTIEPGIYIENFGGVRIEDMVLITESGIENLTKTKKQLLCL